MGQQSHIYIDSLERSLAEASQDSTKADILIQLGNHYRQKKPEKSLEKYLKAISIAKSSKSGKREADGNNKLGIIYMYQGKYNDALACFNKSLSLYDSLNNRSGIALTLNNIGIIYRNQSNFKKAMECFSRSLKLRQELGDSLDVAKAVNNIGLIYMNQGLYEKSLEQYNKSLSLLQLTGDLFSVARTLNNIGIIYHKKGDHKRAMEFYTRTLKVQKETLDDPGIAASLNNIGNIYEEQGGHEQAKKYYKESITIGDKRIKIASLINMGNIYKEQDSLDLALNYFQHGLELSYEIENKQNIASSLHYIGNVYLTKGRFDKAMENFNQSLKIKNEIGDEQSKPMTIIEIGKAYSMLGKYTKSIGKFQEALFLARKMGLVIEIRNASEQLSKLYKKAGNINQSLTMYTLFIEMRDSIINEKNTKAIIQQQFKYEYDKKALADSLKNAEDARIKEIYFRQELSKRQMYTIAGVLSAIFISFIAILLYRRNALKQKANIALSEKNAVINEQKAELQKEKNKMLDSINYALRIQKSMMVPVEEIRKRIPELFVYLRPRDIVSGDFYWHGYKNDIDIIAAIDCTGHGVPGAFMSMIGNTLLNDIIIEKGIIDPGEILSNLHESVIVTLQQDQEGAYAQDGMDISICTINRKNKEIKFAGAKNPLYYIKDKKLELVKGDPFSIGGLYQYARKPQKEISFNTRTIFYLDEISIYLFSDGYMDQHGANKKGAFNTKRFKNMLLDIHNKDSEIQKKIISESMEKWKGDTRQLDDMLVVGFKL